MARQGVNKVILVCRLGQDPEVKRMPNGKAVANFTAATSESWKDQQGQQQDRVEWHRLVAYDKLAEIIGEYLKKGSKVYVGGRLQTREWQDQQGQKRYTTEIVINEMQMLDGKPQGQPAQPQAQQQRQQPAQQRPQQQGGYAQAGSQTMPQQSEPPFSWDDDAPPFV